MNRETRASGVERHQVIMMLLSRDIGVKRQKINTRFILIIVRWKRRQRRGYQSVGHGHTHWQRQERILNAAMSVGGPGYCARVRWQSPCSAAWIPCFRGPMIPVPLHAKQSFQSNKTLRKPSGVLTTYQSLFFRKTSKKELKFDLGGMTERKLYKKT